MSSKELSNKTGGSKTAENNAESSRPASKWAVVVNDAGFPSPQRRVLVRVIKTQASLPDGHILFRDFNSRNDNPLNDDEVIDLAEGNVFYSRAICEPPTGEAVSGKPKLAWFVNDDHEESLRSNQTAKSLRELFQLSPDSSLFRDYESPIDEPVGPNISVSFEDGPVFISRREGHCSPVLVTIFVEGTPHSWPKRKINYEEVVKLEVPEYPQNPPITYAVTYDHGPAENPEGILSPNASVKVKDKMVFHVSETGQS